MTPLSPESVRWLLEFFVRNMDGEHAITMRVVEKCPTGSISYRLPGLPRSFTENAQQIYADGLKFVAVALGSKVENQAPWDSATLQKPELIRKCTESHELIVKGFRGLTIDELIRDVDFNSERFPAVLMADWYVVNMVHYRGIMCACLGSLRVNVPNVYLS
jgi:hypothetical protein